MLLPALCTTRTVLFLTILALYLVDRLLLVGVEGLQRALHLLRCRVMPLTPFRLIPLSLKIISIPSSQVFRVLPLGTTLTTDLKWIVIDVLYTNTS
jgi:hypothetical protein